MVRVDRSVRTFSIFGSTAQRKWRMDNLSKKWGESPHTLHGWFLQGNNIVASWSHIWMKEALENILTNIKRTIPGRLTELYFRYPIPSPLLYTLFSASRKLAEDSTRDNLQQREPFGYWHYLHNLLALYCVTNDNIKWNIFSYKKARRSHCKAMIKSSNTMMPKMSMDWNSILSKVPDYAVLKSH